MRHVALSLVLLVAGCVTPQVIEPPVSGTDFRQYKTIRYTIRDLPTTEYGSGDPGRKYGRETIALFDALLAKKLEAMGYTISQDDAELNLDVVVLAAKPGSAAARFWVGFGAGRAVFLFNADFKDREGRSLGAFQGGRSHTGMEFGQSFASLEEIQSFAATRAAAQVEEFMRSGSSAFAPRR